MVFVILVRLSGLRKKDREVPESETGLVVIALALSRRLARMSFKVAGAARRHGEIWFPLSSPRVAESVTVLSSLFSHFGGARADDAAQSVMVMAV